MISVHPRKGWNNTYMAFEASSSHVGRMAVSHPGSVSFAADTQPSITCSGRCWAASPQTTALILFEQAARPDTPPAL